ncbi:MAG: HD domain-containing protein [Desulfobacterales bacterium]|nr:HD domain-containing protein [Desulfobacterales bacterium]
MNDNKKSEIKSDIELKQLREDLVNGFYRLIQTARVHDDKNQTVKSCLNNFLNSLNTCFEDSDVVDIQISTGRIYLQDEQLYFRKELSGVMQEIIQLIEKRQIQGIRFYPSIIEAEMHQVLEFVRMFYNAGKKDEPQEYIFDRIQQSEFIWTEILHRQDTGSESASLEKIALSKKAEQIKKAKISYSYALSSIKEVVTKIAARKPAGIRKSIRMVQNMVELVLQDDPVLISMSTIKDYDDYTYTHSVNVAILSMCLGKYIGLSKEPLLKLGICGLFHDLGKVDVPQEILNKPGKLNDDEFERMQQHSLDSVRHIIKMNAPRKLKSSISFTTNRTPYEI